MSSSIEEILSRYRPYGPVYKPGDKAPFSGTYVCDRGTMLTPSAPSYRKARSSRKLMTWARTPAGG